MKKALILLLALAALGAQAQTLSKDLLLDFVNTRYQAYFHYNMCTFENLNTAEYQGRTHGDMPPSMWNPTGLDCDQWAQVCIDSKMAGGWLTTKHHGGFCLWDSAVTDYDVASSPVKTDVVKAFTDAFRARGLKIGLYYSILDYNADINHGTVTPEKIKFIQDQLTELLTNYGKIDYINFDGWSTWPTCPDFDDLPYAPIYKTVKALQPDCLIISHTYESNLAHADVPFADAAGRAFPYHPDYSCPSAASDFLERGWWWDDTSYRIGKSVKYILNRLNSYNSHNSVYILNLSPNPAGRIEEAAIKRLAEAAAIWKKPADLKEPGKNWGFQYDVSKNLAFLKTATQSSTRKHIGDKRTSPRAEIAIDGVTEGHAMMEQTSFTKEEPQAWWQVDLEAPCTIDSITIYNRSDKGAEKLSNYTVSIIDTTGKTVWSTHQENHSAPSTTLKTGGSKGKLVKIQLDGNGPLHIAEVIVTGSEQ